MKRSPESLPFVGGSHNSRLLLPIEVHETQCMGDSYCGIVADQFERVALGVFEEQRSGIHVFKNRFRKLDSVGMQMCFVGIVIFPANLKREVIQRGP